jgi:hypothetical protein
MVSTNNMCNYHKGFSRILDSGYDEENDVHFIAMNKLDEDLNTVVNKGHNGCL